MESILVQVENHVMKLFHDFGNPALIYHNIEHTLNVVSRVNEIIPHVTVSERDKLIVITAAWFHDTGQLFCEAKGHEAESVRRMQAFFISNNLIDESSRIEIAQCILATKMPVNPINAKEEILCDADTYHLGTTEFQSSDLKVKLELEAKEHINTDDWDNSTLRFLQQHKYYTDYCKMLLDAGKRQNIDILKGRLQSG